MKHWSVQNFAGENFDEPGNIQKFCILQELLLANRAYKIFGKKKLLHFIGLSLLLSTISETFKRKVDFCKIYISLQLLSQNCQKFPFKEDLGKKSNQKIWFLMKIYLFVRMNIWKSEFFCRVNFNEYEAGWFD